MALRIVIDAQGKAETPEITEHSGSPELDSLAMEAAQSAGPFPPPSSGLREQGKLVLSLPIEFSLRK